MTAAEPGRSLPARLHSPAGERDWARKSSSACRRRLQGSPRQGVPGSRQPSPSRDCQIPSRQPNVALPHARARRWRLGEWLDCLRRISDERPRPVGDRRQPMQASGDWRRHRKDRQEAPLQGRPAQLPQIQVSRRLRRGERSNERPAGEQFGCVDPRISAPHRSPERSAPRLRGARARYASGARQARGRREPCDGGPTTSIVQRPSAAPFSDRP
ncbi:hypothetical protein ABIA03_000070 [Bradyrhizobium yuanmingense]|uniref:Uncharacterized protein n=1 Tax=Bradyrhizobium yuanmingense TaxID=108015 RepID=A0ABV4G7F2_9BRAD